MFVNLLQFTILVFVELNRSWLQEARRWPSLKTCGKGSGDRIFDWFLGCQCTGLLKFYRVYFDVCPKIWTESILTQIRAGSSVLYLEYWVLLAWTAMPLVVCLLLLWPLSGAPWGEAPGFCLSLPCRCCRSCGSTYVGETGRTDKSGQTTNGIAARVHANNTHHSILWDSAEVICRETHWHKRKVQEPWGSVDPEDRQHHEPGPRAATKSHLEHTVITSDINNNHHYIIIISI